jgi:hypothetical protein
MKPGRKSHSRAKEKPGSVVALALTWDGARWPRRSLSAAARAFLGDGAKKIPGKAELAELFRDDEVKEIRVCWVPRLLGGEETLAAPFHTPDGLRINFRIARTRRMGDGLGVVYRRKS